MMPTSRAVLPAQRRRSGLGLGMRVWQTSVPSVDRVHLLIVIDAAGMSDNINA
jgi:hypothetical protein